MTYERTAGIILALQLTLCAAIILSPLAFALPNPSAVFVRPLPPPFVIIDGKKIPIRLVKLPCGRTDLLGCVPASRADIEILGGMSLKNERAVLMHEITHAEIDVTRDGFYHDENVYTEDEFIEKIVHIHVEVLQQNPDLIRYFTAE